jgi:guanidinobutyrase
VHDVAKLGGNWAFAGMVTVFRQPHTHDIAGADVVFLGLPWDGTAMTRSGRRFGPRAIRDESTYELEEMGSTLFDRVRFVDHGHAFFHNGHLFDALDQAEHTVATILASAASLLAAGGDHLIPLPIVRAFAKRLGRPLGAGARGRRLRGPDALGAAGHPHS